MTQQTAVTPPAKEQRMHALTRHRNQRVGSRQRLLCAALAIGIATSLVLVPLSASATDDSGSGFASQPEQLSDEMTASEAEMWKFQQEADAAAKAERLARIQEKIAVMNGFDPDDIYTHSGDVVIRQQLQLEQAQATADAYATDAVYTLYDADAVLASAMSKATQQNVLRMIAPELLAILYGRPGTAFM